MPVALIAEKDCKLLLDIAQMRTTFFDSTDLESADAFRREVVTQLNQALQGDLGDSPRATSIDVRALTSGSAVEGNIADMIAAIEEIVISQRTILEGIKSIQPPTLAEGDLAKAVEVIREIEGIALDVQNDELLGALYRLRLALGVP